MNLFPRFAAFVLFASVTALAQGQSRWLPFGPDGGSARSFAADPSDHNHLFLGTVNGTIYDTHDGGRSWKWLAEPGTRDDLAFDNLLVDPANSSRILAAGWAIDHADGGLYISTDKGKTWTSNPQLKGHSIRSMTIAPSNPKIMLVGALDGVYRTADGGANWALISPPGSDEIHEVESVAIDPKNPQILYAGTWHLPWKTVDGGAHWTNMKEGIIDDSDVFSIIVDPQKPQEIFLSACSGIYRSNDQGEKFVKVQGIPSTARRTRVLMQDPRQPNTVYAGTTEGLWRTADSGKTFLRNGDPGWVINDVAVDPTNSNHVLLATDRTGVLISDDGGFTFTPSNKGFVSRQIAALAQDRSNPRHVWAGVVNDKAAGGVFTTLNGGVTWQQTSTGLAGADVFSLAQAPDGTLLAGTRHGIYAMANDTWQNTGLTLTKAKPTPAKAPARTSSAKGRATASPRTTSTTRHLAAAGQHSLSVSTAPDHDAPVDQSTTGVYTMITAGNTVYAATDDGLVTSADSGHSWSHVASMQGKAWHLLAVNGPRVLTADQRNVALSVDRGGSFLPIKPPAELTYITALTVDSGGRLWIGGHQGVYYSDNDGISWKSLQGLFVPNITSLSFDMASSRVLLTADRPSTMVYAVHVPDLKVSYSDAGWNLRTALTITDYILGVTPYDGVVLQPRMVVSEMGTYH